MNARTATWMAVGFVAGAALIGVLPAHLLFVARDPGTTGRATGGTRYACPMMDFIGYQPGTCPVCGMDLHPVTAGDLQREQQKRMGLELAKVTEGPAVVTVRAYGAAEYDHRFTQVVIPRIAGRIVKRHEATYGCCQIIAAGAPVIDLYSPELIAAQGEYQAALRLGDTNLIRNLRQRFSRWNLTEVADALEKGGGIAEVVTIHSPVGGQVLLEEMAAVDEALEVGREIMPGEPLLRLVDPDKLVLVVHVPEARARFLREGQPVEIESDDLGVLPGLEATIGRLAAEIDPEIRTREVRIWLEGARDVLQPGSLVSARMRGALGPDLRPADPEDESTWGRFPLVPKEAILSTGVRHVAWRVRERGSNGLLQFAIAPVALGPRIEDENGNDRYVVRAGLAPGDEVAAQGAFLIDSQAQLAGTESLLYPTGANAPASGHAH
ncbi:MAG TPA: efflux RND transporter periplasmic adaptor subunit [Kiritimatiellia bacterium]|nr:efflux RND transporter periplasmic adaptor subunit [Kiritimatiellia bacterium]HMP33039.1 efflux RND transporter periplasmic adaptor subunit [Kiritimatiellia bacterium]